MGGFNGILITDRYASYHGYDPDRHQYCWAHVIRNLEKIAGRPGRAGRDGATLGRLAQLVVHCAKRWEASHYQSLHQRRRLERLRQHFRQALTQAAQTHAETRTGQVCAQLLRDSPRLWTFLRYHGVPLTNNAAERTLRLPFSQPLRLASELGA